MSGVQYNGWRENRPTPSQRLHEVTMAALTRAPSPPEHSASAARNAKGIWQLEATVRGYDLDDVIDKAIAAAAKLDAAYPYPSGDDE